MIPVYRPDKYNIGLGVPGTSAYIPIEDWIDLTPDFQAQRFIGSKGILGEPFLEMSTDSSVIYTLNLLQKSPNVLNMHVLYLAQLTGVVGVPFSILDNSLDSNVTQQRQKTIYPVAVVTNEAQKTLKLEGDVWQYQIWSPSGTTVFL